MWNRHLSFDIKKKNYYFSRKYKNGLQHVATLHYSPRVQNYINSIVFNLNNGLPIVSLVKCDTKKPKTKYHPYISTKYKVQKTSKKENTLMMKKVAKQKKRKVSLDTTGKLKRKKYDNETQEVDILQEKKRVNINTKNDSICNREEMKNSTSQINSESMEIDRIPESLSTECDAEPVELTENHSDTTVESKEVAENNNVLPARTFSKLTEEEEFKSPRTEIIEKNQCDVKTQEDNISQNESWVHPNNNVYNDEVNMTVSCMEIDSISVVSLTTCDMQQLGNSTPTDSPENEVFHSSREVDFIETENSTENTYIHQNNFDIVYNAEIHKLTENEEDTLLNLAFLPRTLEELKETVRNETNFNQFSTEYEISDQLEIILAKQVSCRTIQEIRNSDTTHPSINLSPICKRLRPRNVDEFKNIDDSLPDISNLDNSKLLEAVEAIDRNDHSYNLLNETSLGNFTDISLPELDNADEHNASSGTEKSSDELNLNASISRIISKSQKGSCDDTKMIVQTSDEPKNKKQHACMYCHKKFEKVIRHVEDVHKDRKEVKILSRTQKGSKERRDVMRLIRGRGDFLHNTNSKYNNGELIVARRPKKHSNKYGADFKSCPRCFVALSRKNARHHISKCTSRIIQGERTYTILGRLVEGRLHADASDTLRIVVFPVLREDEIVQLIRYDWLIIVYGNKLCLMYTPHYQHNLIRSRLRLIGRFLQALKCLSHLITDLSSAFQAKLFPLTVQAIKMVTKVDPITNTCKTPTVALNLVTYIKQIGKLLESEYIIREDPERQKDVENYLKLHTQSMPVEINKIAMEMQAEIKRQKIVCLPLAEDIKKMVQYLKNERQKSYAELSKVFSVSEWSRLLKLVAVYIMVFNRRRVGDIQNILIENLNKVENIDKHADSESYNLLDEEGKKLAAKYFRILVRGKLNRDVPVLLTSQVLREIQLILECRSGTNVPDRNKFLFGLPNCVNHRIRVVNLCSEMRTVSLKCGAEKPELLRGTALRKHIATKCVELDLEDISIENLANHLGHSNDIHRKIYRQPLKYKTIVMVSKVLEHVSGGDENDDQESDEDDFEINDINNCQKDYVEIRENSNSQEVIPNEINMPSTSCSNEPCTSEKSNCEIHNIDFISTNSYTSDLLELKTDKFQKKRWGEEEKRVVMEAFSEHIATKSLPTFKEIDALKEKNSCLNGRTRQQIKTWISNQFKKPILTKNVTNKKKPTVQKIQKVDYKIVKVV